MTRRCGRRGCGRRRCRCWRRWARGGRSPSRRWPTPWRWTAPPSRAICGRSRSRAMSCWRRSGATAAACSRPAGHAALRAALPLWEAAQGTIRRRTRSDSLNSSSPDWADRRGPGRLAPASETVLLAVGLDADVAQHMVTEVVNKGAVARTIGPAEQPAQKTQRRRLPVGAGAWWPRLEQRGFRGTLGWIPAHALVLLGWCRSLAIELTCRRWRSFVPVQFPRSSWKIYSLDGILCLWREN